MAGVPSPSESSDVVSGWLVGCGWRAGGKTWRARRVAQVNESLGREAMKQTVLALLVVAATTVQAQLPPPLLRRPDHSALDRRRAGGPRIGRERHSGVDGVSAANDGGVHAGHDRVPGWLLHEARLEPRGKTGRRLPEFAGDGGVRPALPPRTALPPSDRARGRAARHSNAAISCNRVATRPGAHRHHGFFCGRSPRHVREHPVRCRRSARR